MISIIICSRKKTIPKLLSVNIDKTIGCEYELIIIDNSQSKYSIFEAYNLGIKKSIGDYLCFIHDDILFHTLGWGRILNEIFKEDSGIGLIGIAGAKSKSKSPSLWWLCPENHKYFNLIQHIPNSSPERWQTGFNKNSIEEVVIIDGVFMVLRRQKDLYFSKKLNGFHNYDLNISFEVFDRGYKTIVTNKILIEHFSLGKINTDWVKSAYAIHKLYNDKLPIFLDERNDKEIQNKVWFIEESIKLSETKIAFVTWLNLFFSVPFFKMHFLFIRFFVKILLKNISNWFLKR